MVAVADELHFGRAAARLGIAQPPLSSRVQRFERLVGVRVFDRDRQGVAMTAHGAEVVEQARRVLAETHALTRLTDGLRDGTRGSLAIGAVGSAFYGALPELLAATRAELPDLELRVSEIESPAQVSALLSGELDVGFLRPPVDAGLDVRVVWRERLVVAVPAEHPLADASHMDAAALVHEPIVFFPRAHGPGYWDQVSDVFRAEGVELAPVAEADHTTTMLGLVSLGIGSTVVPESARAFGLAGVRYLPLRPAHHLDLAVAAASDAAVTNPAVRMLLDRLPVIG